MDQDYLKEIQENSKILFSDFFKIVANLKKIPRKGWINKLEISDPTSGFRMFKKSVLDTVNFSEIKSEGFAFQVELLCYLRRKGLSGIEIPTKFVNRKIGKSKMGFGETIQFSKMCVNLLRNRI